MIHVYRKKLNQWAAELDQARERGNFSLARKAQELIPKMKKLAMQSEFVIDNDEIKRNN